MQQQIGWYIIAKNSTLHKESDINWKDVRNGVGLGAFLGVLPLGVSLMGQPSPNINNEPQQSIKMVDYKTEKAVENTEPTEIQYQPQQETNKPNKENNKSTISEDELRSFIAPFEGGFIPKAYKDTKGIWTIGCGFNLQREDADSILESVGATKKGLISGKETLNQKQMNKIFSLNLKTAIEDARNWIPNLDDHPKEIQLICIDMSFNMGGETLSQFVNTKKAIISKDYAAAAKSMEKSRWYKQVGNRSKHHVGVMRELAKSQGQKQTSQSLQQQKRQP